jgi:hypothetical protein
MNDKHKYEVALESILVDEAHRSFFCTNNNGKIELAYESIKSLLLEKLYGIVTDKISKLDVDFQEILDTKGVYTKYRHYKIINDTVKELNLLLKDAEKTLPKDAINQIKEIILAHNNLTRYVKDFIDAFKYDIIPIKHYYLSVVSSIVYSLGFIVTNMIDYERREGKVAYNFILNNINILEKGLPKNMYSVITGFNYDIKMGNVFKAIKTIRNSNPLVQKEDAMVYEALPFMALAIGSAVALGIIALPALIRHLIYFFLHSKIKLSEYIKQQAYFLELNIRTIEPNVGKNKDIIEKQTKIVEDMRVFATRLSGDRYTSEKQAQSDIDNEDKEMVKETDRDFKESRIDSNPFDAGDGDILL